MKWLMTAAVCGALGGLLLISGDGDNPTPDGLIGRSDTAYWQGYADQCQAFGELYTDGWTPAVMQKWNEELSALRTKTHGEINTRKSQAAEDGTLVEFAEQIRKGNL